MRYALHSEASLAAASSSSAAGGPACCPSDVRCEKIKDRLAAPLIGEQLRDLGTGPSSGQGPVAF